MSILKLQTYGQRVRPKIERLADSAAHLASTRHSLTPWHIDLEQPSSTIPRQWDLRIWDRIVSLVF